MLRFSVDDGSFSISPMKVLAEYPEKTVAGLIEARYLTL
jgi:hypothetical protein